MRITMIDDAIPYDGASPDARPLGGAEKAFVRLAAALQARGHEVSAINRCESQSIVDGVVWLPWDSPRPPETDVLLAFRKPTLLGEVPEASHRCLWLWDNPSLLAGEAERAALARWRPTLVFTGETHSRALKTDILPARVIVPGVAEIYRTQPAADATLTAIVTTHPLTGLQPILRLWRDRIHPERPGAELHIYSAGLHKALAAGAAGDRLRPIYDEVRAAQADSVTVYRPLADAGMAEAYARARVHLYPVISREMYASTLAESQAAGLPALVRATGGTSAQLLERVKNGMTGYFTPDDDAFVNLTLALLDADGAVYRNLAQEARAQQRSRGWNDAAIEFEAMWT
jgi:glycosyltransferase involved in cell wall biosynthesis